MSLLRLSAQAALLLGLVSANAAWFERLHQCVHLMAIPPSPEDVFLALRGLRTMELRLREAECQGLALAQWFEHRPEVLRVIHPAVPDHPGHALWKRDYSGSSGLFSIVLKPASEAAVAAFLDRADPDIVRGGRPEREAAYCRCMIDNRIGKIVS